MPDEDDTAGEEERRTRIHELLRELALIVDGERSLVYGWTLIVEWSAADGDRWLTYLATDALGGPAPTWQPQGHMHHALHDWPNRDKDDDT